MPPQRNGFVGQSRQSSEDTDYTRGAEYAKIASDVDDSTDRVRSILPFSPPRLGSLPAESLAFVKLSYGKSQSSIVSGPARGC